MEEANLLDENVDVRSESSAPSKNFVVRNKRKFAGFTVVIVVVVLSLFDVWYGLVHNSDMKVKSAEVSFESDANSDATLTVNGRMASQSYLSSLSVDDTYCSTQYSNGDATSSWQDLARVKGTVSTKTRSGFELKVALSEVSYSPLRHLLSDAYWNNPTGISVQCHAGVTLYLYRVIPVHLYTDIGVTVTTPTPDAIHVKYSSSGISGTGAFKFSAETDLAREDGDEKTLQVRTMLHWLQKRLVPMQKWLSQNFKHVYDTQTAGIHGSFKNKFDTSEYAESFIVKVPQLSVATTLLGDKEENGRYVLASTPFQLQFSAKEVDVEVDFALQCSDSFDAAAPESTELHECSLFDGKGLKALWDTLNAGLLSIAMDSASKRNFLTELAGPHHSLIGETVDMADVEAKIAAVNEQTGATSPSASGVASLANNLIGNELTTIQDPRISTGGRCVAGNADNVYDTYTCAIIEKGFFKVYLYVVDADGFLTKIEILTSWAPSAPFASATQASVISRGGYVGQLNATISELWQNASMSARVDEDGVVALRSEAVAAWDLKDPVESGMVNFIGYVETIADRGEFSTGLTYGDNAYSTYLNAKYNSSTDGPNSARLSAEGGYGGNYYNWHLSVDNAEAFANADKLGDANSYISSTVSTTGDAANFQFDLVANDGSEVQQLGTQNSIVWNSPDEFWTSSGLIKIDSLTNIINTIDWNADAALSYAENAYSFVVRDVSADETSDIFLTQGNGNYGGNWNNWWADLAESSVTINDGLVGNATGAISAAVSSTGDAAVITFLTQAVDANAVEQFYTSNNASWSSASFWTEAGTLAANSVVRLIDSLYWNAHGDFTYGDNAFYGKASEVDATGFENFLVDAVGAYGGTWTRWWARLDSGALYLSEAKVGSTEGEVYSTVEVDGSSGYVTLAGSVADASDNQILRTYEVADWHSDSWNWLETGRLSAISQFNYPSFAYWNTTGQFSYGDHVYSINATDMSANYEDKVFDLYGVGNYGGDWNYWHAALTDSFVYIQGSKVGAIVGEIISKVTPGASTAYLSFSTTVTDGNDIEQVKTEDVLQWESPSGDWLSSADIEVSSMFYLIDSSVNWKADGAFSYGDHQYSIFLEDYTTYDEMVFKADASGLYHGTWTDFSASVTLGELYVSGALYGTVKGNFGSAVTATGDAADIVLYAVVNDGSGNEQLFTNSSVAWNSPSAWTQAGQLAASSGFRLVNTLSFDADGSLQYSDHQYSFIVQEHQFDGFTDFLAGGSGRYGGSWTAFWASLEESTLIVSESQIGSATGLFSSEVTSNFDTGLVSFTALGFDASEIVQFSTNNTATWESPIYDWVTQGNISIASATQVADLIDWEASAQVSFNDGTYNIAIIDNDLDGTPVFLTQGVGSYGGTYGNWHVSVDDSVCYISDVKQGQANGKIAWLNVDWFNVANLEVRANVTDGSDLSLVSTTNILAWYNLGYYEGLRDFAQGVISSDTSIEGSEAFYLVSSFTLDQTARNASFVVYDKYMGESGLALTSRAFYDQDFGMITGIDATVAYADELIFEAHTSWDAQLKTADLNPTMQPTVSPSEEPTPAPTDAPTEAPTDAPTDMPTANPTVTPGQPTAAPTAQPSNPTAQPTTAVPTRPPTVMPTTIPTRTPTSAPSVAATRAPTRAPSAAPSQQTSPILTFVSDITLGGVTAPTLDYTSQQAMISVTASSMGLSANTVTYVGSHSTGSTGRRFLKSQKSVFVTTYTVVANMQVSVPVTTGSSTDLYNSLTNQLTTAVTSNQFSNDLQQVSTQMGATETAAATANSVSNGPAETQGVPSSGGSGGLSAGAIAGIVIGTVAGLAIIVALVWFFVVQGGSPGAADAFAPGGARSTSGSSQNTTGQRGSTISNASGGSRSPKKSDPTGADKVFSTENPLSSKKHSAQVGDENL